MKRIGLMGCGTVADYGHIPVILKTPGLTLHAVYEPNPDRLEYIQEKFGIANGFVDEEAFFGSGLDAVSITSPAPCHLANVRTACCHGKHILCEKPLAMNASECQEMIDGARQAGVMLFTGFDYRFSPAALKIREWAREGAIGEVRSLRLIYIWHCHGKMTRNSDGGWTENQRRQGRMLEGGPLVDCGVHQIDLARFWTGSEVVDWSVAGAWVDDYEAADHVYLHMDHENGAHAMVEISFSYCHTCQEPVNVFTYDLIGTNGVIRYDRNARLFEMRNRDGVHTETFSPEKNFAAMYELYRDPLEQGTSELLPTGWDGLVAARISREASDELIRRHRKS
ncbi:MAG: Gfo/Idh/MocA family oxidoreductase [Lentisphaeria bacterium]|nr:Gfo/Idh/MocA family oxidoreductase [Lentisphaeria bacterium]